MTDTIQEIWATKGLLGLTTAGEVIWMPVVGSDGWYEVSNMGDVRSWAIRGSRTRRASAPYQLRPSPNTDGYPCASVRKNGKLVFKPVHQLVAESFIGQRPGPIGEWEVGHDDGTKDNNRLDNLKWCTLAVNHLDRRRHDPEGKRLRPVREIAGVKWYQCTGKCKKWKPFYDFRKLTPKHASVCGIHSACIACQRKRGCVLKKASRERAKMGSSVK